MRDAHLRNGFTLVELLIALALMSVVMLAITTAINLLYQTQTLSHHQVLHSQLVHRLFEQFERDLRHVVVPSTSEQSVTTEEDQIASLLGTLNGDQTGTDMSGAVMTEAEEVPLFSTMVGTADQLTLWVEQPLPSAISTLVADPALAETALSIAAEGGRSQLITWGLTAAEELPAPGLLPGNTLMAIRQIDLTMPTGELQPLTASDAYEIVSCSFSYYDGTSWLTDWSSELQVSALPVAIEMVVQTALKKHDDNDSFTTSQTGLKTWRRVFVTRDMSQSTQLVNVEEAIE